MCRLKRVFEQTRTPFSVQLQAVQAILNEILSFVPDEFESFEELYEILKLASETATSRLLDDLIKRHPEGAEEIIREERNLFRQELQALDRNQINAKQVLPYVRTLSHAEAAEIWRKITQKWGLKQNHWYPIYGPPRPTNALAFLVEIFEVGVTPKKLQSILRDHDVRRVFEFSESSPIGLQGGWPETEMALELLEPRYGQAAGAEGYWFSKEMDWLIYASHESSITIGGRWLIEAVKHAWPNWEDGLYEKYPIARWHLGDYRPDV